MLLGREEGIKKEREYTLYICENFENYGWSPITIVIVQLFYSSTNLRFELLMKKCTLLHIGNLVRVNTFCHF